MIHAGILVAINFFKINEDKFWRKFKASVLYVEDPDVKLRLQTCVDSTPNPFSTEIWYHGSCRKEAQSKSNERNLQNVTEKDVEQNFMNYVSDTIVADEEPKTLKSLCNDFKVRLENFGFFRNIKSDRLKELLIHNFGGRIGFHSRVQRNQSDIVYSRNKGKTYFEAILNGSEVTDAELFHIAANRLRESLKKEARNRMVWPPTVNTLCTEQRTETVVSKFLRTLSNINEGSKNDSKIMFLSECIESLVTKEKTRLETVFAITLHGITRNKELVKFSSDLGIGLSYNSLLGLNESWALDEFENNEVCPAEIAEYKPGTVIIDIDDFKDDDLTGGMTSHRTNMMFVQPMKWIEDESEPEQPLRINARQKLKEIILEKIKILSYKSSTRGEPPPFKPKDLLSGTTDTIRKILVTHALVRQPMGEGVSSDEQRIGAFTGFMSLISPNQDKSKPYYFVTLPKPPSKAVVYTLMEKAEAAARLELMPLIQFVADQPVFAHVVDVKYEIPEKFNHILTVLGSFHIQRSYMTAIYKRIKESNIKDLLVEAGLIVQGSIVQALRGDHCNRATRLYKLFYESMVRIIINRGKNNNI